MINFYDGQLTDLLPHNLTDDPAAQAYSYALREGTRLLYRYTQLCYVYCSIDTMPDKILNLLAVELRTQYYKDSLDIETKRGLVRNTLIWYMTAGTPAAVEELVTVVFGEGEVSEWFEYGGKPYWFKIKTNAILTEDMITYFFEMIRRVKNTRSHIQAIEIHRTVEQTIYSGAFTVTNYKPPAIIDGYEEAGDVTGIVYMGAGETSQIHQSAISERQNLEHEEVYVEPLMVGAATRKMIKPAAIIDGFF